MYIDKSEIKAIQLDHTSRCNLLCPQCARTENNLLNPNLKIQDLTIDNYKVIFEFLSRDIKILHCGNYGDVVASPTFDETLLWCIDNGFHNIQIVTNGSARNINWWKNLAKLGVNVVFSIDGLEDTNHLYRINSNFKKIIENVTAFTSMGGIARWDFLVFDHNQHQIDQAKTLAKSIGVQSFNVKQSSRFVLTHENVYSGAILNKKNIKIIDIKSNSNTENFNKIISEYSTFDEYVKKTKIDCKYKKDRRYYIDMEMRLWPCCWMGAPIYFNQNKNQYKEMIKVFEMFGEDFNKLDIHGWDGVLSSDYFQYFLESTWEPDNSNRLFVCGRTCGEKYQFSSGYGSNTQLIKL